MSNLHSTSLGDIANIGMGQSPDSATYNQVEKGLPFLQGCGDFGVKHPYPTVYCSIPTRIAPKGSILISVRAPVGELNRADKDYCIGRGLSFISKKSADLTFLFYYLLENKWRFESVSQGSTFSAINSNELHSFKVLLPDILSQTKIAEILTTVDNLIEQTEAAIAKYHVIKQGMMHDLFTRGMDANGQLRPPREEAPGLYKESELGWIPKEWAAKPLEQLLEGNPKNGYSPREVDEWQGIYMLGLGCLTPRGFKPIQLKFAPINDRKISSALLSDGDLLISRANTIDLVGLVGIYKSIGEKCIYPDLMMRLKILPTIRSEFLEFTLQHYATRRKLTCLSQGTSSSMVKINAVNVKKLTIPYPGIPEQDSIIHALSSILANIKSEYEKMQKYQTIKSGLMQDLLSGRVRVPTDATPRQEPSHVS